MRISRMFQVAMAGPLTLEDRLTVAYVDHATAIFRVVRALVTDDASAEDITHDAFIRAMQKLDRFDPGREMLPWLMTIATRLTLDHLRRQRFRRSVVSAISRHSSPPVAAYNDGELDADAALSILNPKERVAVVARHYVGMSYREIGEVIGTSESAAGVTLHRAHAKLRAVLRSQGTFTRYP